MNPETNFKKLHQHLISAILASDTPNALIILEDKETQTALHDPMEGQHFHAEILYYAIKKANLELIKHLLRLCIDSDLSFFQYCGHTPLSLAQEENLNIIIPLMLEKTDKNFALMMAVKFKDNKLIDLLLKKCIFKERFLSYLGLLKKCEVVSL